MNATIVLSMTVGLLTAVSLIPLPKLRWTQQEVPEENGLSRLKEKRKTVFTILEQRLQPEQTGIGVRQYAAITCGAGGLAILLCHAILDSWMLSLPFFAMGILASERIIMLVKTKRKEQFEEGNVRALRVMAASLRTNPSYLHAFQTVADSMFVPLIVRNEYQRLVKLLRGQVPLEMALREMQERTSSSDISYLTTILLVQRELGGDMAKTLDAAATAILRRRQMQRRQRAALTQILSQVNLLTIMPFIFVMALYANNPRHFEPLTQTLQGRVLLLGAFLAILIGGEIIRYIALYPLSKREAQSK